MEEGFFAAADNLDKVLDEFEQREEEEFCSMSHHGVMNDSKIKIAASNEECAGGVGSSQQGVSTTLTDPHPVSNGGGDEGFMDDDCSDEDDHQRLPTPELRSVLLNGTESSQDMDDLLPSLPKTFQQTNDSLPSHSMNNTITTPTDTVCESETEPCSNYNNDVNQLMKFASYQQPIPIVGFSDVLDDEDISDSELERYLSSDEIPPFTHNVPSEESSSTETSIDSYSVQNAIVPNATVLSIASSTTDGDHINGDVGTSVPSTLQDHCQVNNIISPPQLVDSNMNVDLNFELNGISTDLLNERNHNYLDGNGGFVGNILNAGFPMHPEISIDYMPPVVCNFFDTHPNQPVTTNGEDGHLVVGEDTEFNTSSSSSDGALSNDLVSSEQQIGVVEESVVRVEDTEQDDSVTSSTSPPNYETIPTGSPLGQPPPYSEIDVLQNRIQQLRLNTPTVSEPNVTVPPPHNYTTPTPPFLVPLDNSTPMVSAPPNRTLSPPPSVVPQPPSSLSLLDEESSCGSPDDLPSCRPRIRPEIGLTAPKWVPDQDAPNCMMCYTKFTFTKRRHHCRSCGLVFCSSCCNKRAKLKYMEYKLARVCDVCAGQLNDGSSDDSGSPSIPIFENGFNDASDIMGASIQGIGAYQRPDDSPNPNNPMEYCSTVSPWEQAKDALTRPPPCVMVPVAPALRNRSQPANPRKEGRHVRFADGIDPGCDLADEFSTPTPVILPNRTGKTRIVPPLSQAKDAGQCNGQQSTSGASVRPKHLSSSNLPVTLSEVASQVQDTVTCESGLPPVIRYTENNSSYVLDTTLTHADVIAIINDETKPAVCFQLNQNFTITVDILTLDCCIRKQCWCFFSKGLHYIGQDEVVILLEMLPDENTVPVDMFAHYRHLYENASKGEFVTDMGNTLFNQPCMGSRDHAGFLYIHPTFQCLKNLTLPSPPFVFGILLQKWEIPWVKLFPIRLMLRLGAEFRYYPCPILSVRNRKPVYGEIGHTIMNLLADFKNFQYTLPQIHGLVIHLENKRTTIIIPSNRYDDVMRVINSSNEHVLALAGNFSRDADSHLVCIQNDDGNYRTQGINIQNKARKVTGASFVVFNGALKTSSGLLAKSSIVEDGVMVQVYPDTMKAIRQALHHMEDMLIKCGNKDQTEPDEVVQICWGEEDCLFNIGIESPIDGLSMQGVTSLHVRNTVDIIGENYKLHWINVFFLQNEDFNSRKSDPVDLSRLAERLADACCIALTPHLHELKDAEFMKIGLRVTIESDKVGYSIGSNGQLLPTHYMNDLDNELIPVIHNAAYQYDSGPVTMELVFNVLEWS